MAVVTGDRYLESLVKFVENQAEKLIEGTLVLKLNPVGLRYVQSRLEAFGELESLLSGAPVDYLRAYVSDLGDHRALEQLRRILRLLPSLKLVSLLPPLRRDPTPLFLLPFGSLKVLELRGCDLSTSAAKGLLELRLTLEKLICHNSTDALRHIFASRIADIKDSPQWNRLSFVSCACNDLILMDESLQLLPLVETLDLSRNKFAKVDNLWKCTKLKHVDLGFNNLRSIASLSEVSCQIVKLVLRNNALTSLHGIENLKSLQGLDVSYNIISNFSEIEVLAGIPSLEILWLEGNPLCYARWFRAKVFSLFSHPYLLKLDEKKISACEDWKRKIIISGRQKQPASFGFYSPIRYDADVEEGAHTKKRRSRLAYIENDEQMIYIADRDSVSCDNEIKSKGETVHTEEPEIEDLIKRIENLKKDRSSLWLEEFQEWMNQTSETVVDGSRFKSVKSHRSEEMCVKSESEDADHAEPSRYISDSFQLSGDESSTIILGSETSFADTSVVSAQQYFDRIGEASSRLFMGHGGGDRSVFKNFSESHEELRYLNNEGSMPVDAVYLRFNSLEMPRWDNLTAENMSVPSTTAINNIMGTHFSSAFPASPPHYQEDILHRRHNLEEEFLQLSAESFSVTSSDSNTSCSDHDSARVGPSMSHIDHSVIESSSERSNEKLYIAASEDDAKQNGTDMSASHSQGNSTYTNGRELEIALPGSGRSLDDSQDDENLEFIKGKTGWLEKIRRRRKTSRRMNSLPEEDDVPGDTNSSRGQVLT
ncbi:serine/threonine-protein kinase 11-interacting protein-like isoform X1 [Salvia splendens]|uniref:serine/threonine-protein kinase 11-interacting protein-like isoform X1 n=1 Tax=Salvia splendens TaxID=180675 RepID=UPI001C26717E|nr:serine/threonine-protein kinase 11-interacting protein-like isoform X1 [Salvia splendens]XP_042064722.1 serine/threonine-protein kinase 11-interacting protein-like isoform X1 [Salvia splendens]